MNSIAETLFRQWNARFVSVYVVFIQSSPHSIRFFCAFTVGSSLHSLHLHFFSKCHSLNSIFLCYQCVLLICSSVGKLDLWSYKFKRSQSSLVKAAHWTPFFFAFFFFSTLLSLRHPSPSLYLSRVFELVVILFPSVILSMNIAIRSYNSPICYGLALASKQWYNRNEKKNTTQKTTEKRIMFGKLDMQHDKHESHIRWLGVFVPSSFCSLL